MPAEANASKPSPEKNATGFRYLRNWLSLSGLVVAVAACFAFVLLFVLDSFAHFSNPYMGVVIYLVAPGFLILALMVFFLSAVTCWPS